MPDTIEPTSYDLDLAFAIENSPPSYQLGMDLITTGTIHGNPRVIVETPDGPLAIGAVSFEDGVLKIFTLE